ncbi:hypothetical protein ACS85_06110 [Vibrio parahaemolyticus]|uniref:toll/interleukin-1 receptor domain-containing protein n=1 Tax=Vibrio parahaemolyticus TaxID=670 RepID=UPI0006A703BC|nr:toll/interleukin-1 receptor domain-containing protein [Vibrio parahaemolyticus]KOE14595.1 hypothetical protein ACS85_06110 [Vibrio parahaemolyticus]
MNHKLYLFSLDYGNRAEEKVFVKEILDRFDSQTLVGCGTLINNNPYNLELFLFLNFEKDDCDFDHWLSVHYPNKSRTFNVLMDELTEAAFSRRGYSITTFCDSEEVDLIFSSEANELFLFPDRGLMYEVWGAPIMQKQKIFLSHSSRDKHVVDDYFSELQKSQIKAWYDKEEIIPGDSITSRINEGLNECDLGVLFMSNNFLSKHSGWTEAESNFFISNRMKKNKSLIVVNLGVEHEDIPPLLQDYLYIDGRKDTAIDELIFAAKKQLERI